MDIQTLQKLQAMQQQAAAPKPLVGALAGDISLNDMVDSKRTQVLNCDSSVNDTEKELVLKGLTGLIKSDEDVDEQLLVTIPFKENVKVKGIMIKAETKLSDDSGPCTVKIFANQPHYGFSDCESSKATQTVTLTADDIKEGKVIKLKFVKFQNVSCITLFFPDNQDDAEVTFINSIGFTGQTIGTFKVEEIKKC